MGKSPANRRLHAFLQNFLLKYRVSGLLRGLIQLDLQRRHSTRKSLLQLQASAVCHCDSPETLVFQCLLFISPFDMYVYSSCRKKSPVSIHFPIWKKDDFIVITKQIMKKYEQHISPLNTFMSLGNPLCNFLAPVSYKVWSLPSSPLTGSQYSWRLLPPPLKPCIHLSLLVCFTNNNHISQQSRQSWRCPGRMQSCWLSSLCFLYFPVSLMQENLCFLEHAEWL